MAFPASILRGRVAIAGRLKQFLDGRGARYDLVPHPHSASSLETARVAHVDGERLAKSVLLKDERGYLLAVLPASQRLSLDALGKELERRLELASEPELADIFDDCEVGAVPPIGGAYGMPAVLDEGLLDLADVYFEAGDHEHLVHMSGAEFAALFPGERRARYSAGGARSTPALRSKRAREARLDAEQPHVFSLRAYGAGLRRQPEYQRDGHTGMILMKTPELRIVLQAVRAGTTLATHVVHGPTQLYVIDGALDVNTPDGSFRVGEAEMALLPADEERELHSPGHSLFLLALAPVRPAEAAPTPAVREQRRILIVANQTMGSTHLVDEVKGRMRRARCEFVVLAPASPSSPGVLREDKAAREEARERLDAACERLRRVGASVTGVVGDFYPLRAIQDLLLVEEFDEIIVSTLPQGPSEWLRMDLPSRVARRFGLPVTHVVSPE